MRTRLAMRDHANPATSQAVDAAYRIDRDIPAYGRECRYNGMSINEIVRRSLD